MIDYESLKKIFKLIFLVNLFFYLHFFEKKIYYENCNHFFPKQLYLSEFKYIDLFLNLTPINYYYSYKFNIIEIEFNIAFYDKNKNLIIPSNLVLYNDLHIVCFIKKEFNINIYSLSNIYKNKYINCVEYFNLNEKVKIGIIIFKNNEKIATFYFFDHKSINYNDLNHINDNKFDYLIINSNYISTIKKKENSIINNLILLNNISITNPFCLPKELAAEKKDIWTFKNIYNHYFCFCYGKDCLYDNIPQECKYLLYLTIINDNKNLYNKTDYLLADFLFENRAPGDAYLLFKEMIKRNISSHYVTERKDIYDEFNSSDNGSLTIIPIINKQYNITGNTLEKYLDLFLKLKAVISGAEFYSIYNIFYNIDYITFICLGHGVNYFKSFLFNDYYGCKRYNKIILPSNIIIEIAKKYGWTDDNIIKIGLPKWDFFDNYRNEISRLSNKTNVFTNNSIFIMFTWRDLNNGENLSNFYFNNIVNLLNNSKLNKALGNNITLYISLHHNLLDKKNMLNLNGNIHYVKQEDILECLTKCNLLITDFSSVIFDFIYQKKPTIIYIPDSDDSNLKNIYTKEYYDVINGLKNDSIYFENKFFNIEDTITKIIYYINNNFKIEKKLEIFYDQFEFNGKNRINTLINYLKSL